MFCVGCSLTYVPRTAALTAEEHAAKQSSSDILGLSIASSKLALSAGCPQVSYLNCLPLMISWSMFVGAALAEAVVVAVVVAVTVTGGSVLKPVSAILTQR